MELRAGSTLNGLQIIPLVAKFLVVLRLIRAAICWPFQWGFTIVMTELVNEAAVSLGLRFGTMTTLTLS